MNLLNLEEEKFKNVKVRGYEFKIKFMSTRDRVEIARKRMVLQGGNPISSLTDEDFMFFENISMVDVCVEEIPKELEKLENKSCMEWDDVDLINELANSIRKHTETIELRLKKNRPIEGSLKV